MRARSHGAALGAIVAIAVTPAMAEAATRYAAPAGDGDAAICAQEDPCSVQAAVEDPSAQPDDEVILLPGTYEDQASSLQVDDAIEIRSQDPAAPVTLRFGGTALDLAVPGVALSDLRIETGGAAIFAQRPATIDRVIARTTGLVACQTVFGGLVMRDSACQASRPGGTALEWNLSAAGANEVSLRNTTLVAQGEGSFGIRMAASEPSALSLVGRNVIASAETDVYARANLRGSSSVALESSNFNSVTAEGQGTVTVPVAGGGLNQTDPPLFADAQGGDLRQAAGSPTIDAGTVDPLLGTSDPWGDPRVVGNAPDIGADEHIPAIDPPPPPSAPATFITTGPKRKLKTRKRRAKVEVTFSSDNPAARFECSLDGSAFRPCTSPFRTKVKKGKHRFAVRAVSADAVADATPAEVRWKVKRKRR